MASGYRANTSKGDNYDQDSDVPGVAFVGGLIVFLLIIGFIGWNTRPTTVVYPHACYRYDMDEDEDWEEGFEPTNGKVPAAIPAKPRAVAKATKAGAGLKSNKSLDKASSDVIKAAMDKRMKRRTPIPTPKPVAKAPADAMKPPPPPAIHRAEGFTQETQKKKGQQIVSLNMTHLA